MKIQSVILSVFLCVGMVHAQMIGNPVESTGSGEWTISASGTYMKQYIDMPTAMKRLFLKSNWGITRWLDLYILGGGIQLELGSTRPEVEDYKDQFRVGYGVGYNITLKPKFLPIFSICIGAQAIRFVSNSYFSEDFFFNNQTYQSIFEMKYDWREVKMHAGLVFPHRMFRFYAAGAVWLVQRIEYKNEYWDTGDSRSFIGKEDGEFNSGFWTGGIVGVDILLPQNFAISVEGLFFNMYDFQIMIGVSQTGGSRW